MTLVERAINRILPLVFVTEAALTACSPKNIHKDPKISPTPQAITLTVEPPTPTRTATIPSTETPSATPSLTKTTTPTETATLDSFHAFVEECKHLNRDIGYVGCLYAEGEDFLMELKLKTGGANNVTNRNGEATLLSQANVKVILAHFNLEGHKFLALPGKVIYYINGNGTWETYYISAPEVDYYDINGEFKYFSKDPYPYSTVFPETVLENMYWFQNRNPGIMVFEVSLYGPIPPEGYTNPPDNRIGVTFLTATRFSEDTPAPTP